MIKLTEQVVHRAIKENPDACLRHLKLLGSEVPLLSALEYLQRDVYERFMTGDPMPANKNIGRIDLLLQFKNKRYVTEIKFRDPDNSSSDFWEALKVVGYCAYYQWMYNCPSAKAAIIVPRHCVKLEHQIVAGNLGIQIFGAFTQDNQVKLQPILDVPIWKQ